MDLDRAVARLMRFLAVEGVTGQEKAIASEVARHLREAGVLPGSMKFDTANERIPLPTETGNLIVTLPGTRPRPAPALCHAPSTRCRFVPERSPSAWSKDRIKAQGETALGGDNPRTGVARLVNLAATLLEQNYPHPPHHAVVHRAARRAAYPARGISIPPTWAIP